MRSGTKGKARMVMLLIGLEGGPFLALDGVWFRWRRSEDSFVNRFKILPLIGGLLSLQGRCFTVSPIPLQ